jgi:hypothetical protein
MLIPDITRIITLRREEMLGQARYLPCWVSRRRIPPTPALLAGYVGDRCGQATLAAAVKQQFEFAFTRDDRTTPKSVAAYSRLFSRFGVFTARDWRAIAILAWEVSQSGHAGKHYVTAVTRERHAHQYLQQTLPG